MLLATSRPRRHNPLQVLEQALGGRQRQHAQLGWKANRIVENQFHKDRPGFRINVDAGTGGGNGFLAIVWKLTINGAPIKFAPGPARPPLTNRWRSLAELMLQEARVAMVGRQ